MILSNTIIRVRRKVRDWFDGDSAQQILSDDYYEDAITDGIGRLNTDIGTAYVIGTVPTMYEWVVVLLAAIEIASTFAISPPAEDETGSLKRVEVDGFESEHYESHRLTASDWIDLIEQWENRYRNWVDESVGEVEDNQPPLTYKHIHKASKRTGGAYLNYEMDPGVDAPDMTLSETGSYLLLSWSKVRNKQFKYYNIQRKLADGDWETPADITNVTTIYDNHIESFRDKTYVDLSAGDYVYRITVVNKNLIRKSTEASITKV